MNPILTYLAYLSGVPAYNPCLEIHGASLLIMQPVPEKVI